MTVNSAFGCIGADKFHLMQDRDEKLVFEVLVDSFKNQLNKLLYSNQFASEHDQQAHDMVATIKKKQLFTILFNAHNASEFTDEINVSQENYVSKKC